MTARIPNPGEIRRLYLAPAHDDDYNLRSATAALSFSGTAIELWKRFENANEVQGCMMLCARHCREASMHLVSITADTPRVSRANTCLILRLQITIHGRQSHRAATVYSTMCTYCKAWKSNPWFFPDRSSGGCAPDALVRVRATRSESQERPQQYPRGT